MVDDSDQIKGSSQIQVFFCCWPALGFSLLLRHLMIAGTLLESFTKRRKEDNVRLENKNKGHLEIFAQKTKMNFPS